jgi:hypothetical protein
VTKGTSGRVIETLEHNGWIVIIPRSEVGVEYITDSRRRVLKAAYDEDLTHMHLVDMDRVLHWALNYRDELEKSVIDIPRHDFIIFGRTKRALYTHPRNQVETEAIANHVFSLILGSSFDITAASRGISHRAAETILVHSRGRFFDSDSEWPIILHRTGFNIYYKEVDGLEWETQLKRTNISDLDNGVDLKEYYETNPESWVYRLMLSYRIARAAHQTYRSLSQNQRVS